MRAMRTARRSATSCATSPAICAHVPDLVVRPSSEQDVVDVLDWCGRERIAVIPYGGGSSVCGGVEPRLEGDYAGAVSLDVGRLGRVLEIDRTSRAARIQAGVLGPGLEDQLRPHGLTLRHFPQSFEFSTLGGWLATRRADTSRPCTPISTTWSSRCGW